LLRAFYLAEESRHPVALRLCLAFICLGLLLLAIPAGETFVLVIWKFFLPSIA
jgi:hypothetical protein